MPLGPLREGPRQLDGLDDLIGSDSRRPWRVQRLDGLMMRRVHLDLDGADDAAVPTREATVWPWPGLRGSPFCSWANAPGSSWADVLVERAAPLRPLERCMPPADSVTGTPAAKLPECTAVRTRGRPA